MERQTNDKAPAPASPAPAELSVAQLELISGGLNPQPLPPRVEPEMRF
ncbi:hypothetical protein [Acidisphaera sp. S103]|nr:hypothetical protein [Acidisphaera sp. S103]